jgi:hypothetical protein
MLIYGSVIVEKSANIAKKVANKIFDESVNALTNYDDQIKEFEFLLLQEDESKFN